MELFRLGTDVWGREVVQGVSWDLLPVFFWAGVLFICVHALLSALRRKR